MKRLLQISVALLALMSVAYAFAHTTGWLQEEAVRTWFENNSDGRFFLALAVVALLAVDLFLPIPSSLVMTASGSLLGFRLAFAANLAGSLLCACIGFGLCRWLGRPFFLRVTHGDDLARGERFWERYGGWGVALSRALPMFTELISCLAGLMRMNFLSFFIFTLVGAFPFAALYAWAGQHGMMSGGGWAFLLALAVSALGFAALQRNPKSPPQNGH